MHRYRRLILRHVLEILGMKGCLRQLSPTGAVCCSAGSAQTAIGGASMSGIVVLTFASLIYSHRGL
eukprot:1591654-Amphidinium_carterae.1